MCPFSELLWSSLCKSVTSVSRSGLLPSSRCNNVPLETRMLFQVRVLNASCYFNPRLSRIVLAIPWAVDVQVYVCLGQPALQGKNFNFGAGN